MMDIILFDGAGAGLMNRDGDLEVRVCSLTTWKKGSNASGCHTENNLSSYTDSSSNHLDYIGLAKTSITVNKEDGPRR